MNAVSARDRARARPVAQSVAKAVKNAVLRASERQTLRYVYGNTLDYYSDTGPLVNVGSPPQNFFADSGNGTLRRNMSVFACGLLSMRDKQHGPNTSLGNSHPPQIYYPRAWTFRQSPTDAIQYYPSLRQGEEVYAKSLRIRFHIDRYTHWMKHLPEPQLVTDDDGASHTPLPTEPASAAYPAGVSSPSVRIIVFEYDQIPKLTYYSQNEHSADPAALTGQQWERMFWPPTMAVDGQTNTDIAALFQSDSDNSSDKLLVDPDLAGPLNLKILKQTIVTPGGSGHDNNSFVRQFTIPLNKKLRYNRPYGTGLLSGTDSTATQGNDDNHRILGRDIGVCVVACTSGSSIPIARSDHGHICGHVTMATELDFCDP